MNFFDRLNALNAWWTSRKRTCVVSCPNCSHDLNGDDKSFVSDIDGIVKYTCASCGQESNFDFAHYPVPILIEAHHACPQSPSPSHGGER